MTNRRVPTLFLAALMALGGTFLSVCTPTRTDEPEIYRQATDIAQEWNRMLLQLEWHTEGYRPPVTARMFAYAGMAAYEASLPALNGYASLDTHLKGYQSLVFEGGSFSLPLALNEAYATMATLFFPTAPPEFKGKIVQLHDKYAQLYEDSGSMEFGKNTALAVWKYSMQDSVGHDGFLYNYDKQYVPPACRGCWEMESERPMPALLPNWGQARPFLVDKTEWKARPPVTYGEKAPSPFFSEAMEVFSISNSLTSEDKWIAEFWSDDLPGLTVTPTGRWISIANQAIEKAQPPFPQVMEIYLKTGFALCDAAITCWYNKYKFNVVRPETYIRNHIAPDWHPLHGSPSFPSYPSGHSIFGAAAAQVLSAMLGADFSMTDRTHEGRREFVGKPRQFNSFEEMATENAYSRVLLGVHFRMDCEEGLRLGKGIGKRIADFSLLKGQATILKTH